MWNLSIFLRFFTDFRETLMCSPISRIPGIKKLGVKGMKTHFLLNFWHPQGRV